jgi:hypothetical protein
VRTNIARSTGDGTFDAAYATSLSADAVPVLVEAIQRLGYHDRRGVARGLGLRWNGVDEGDLRAWSVARWLAFKSLREKRDALAAADTSILPLETKPAIRAIR